MLSRRAFLQSAIAGPLLARAGAGPLPSPFGKRVERRISKNRFFKDGRPLIVSVEGENVTSLLERAWGSMPGVETAIHGRRVVLKPNATASQPYPVTTDPALLRALIRLLKGAGAAEITICDSPSYSGLSAEAVFRKLGYRALAKEEDVKVEVVDSEVGSDFVRVDNERWRCHPRLLTGRVVHDSDFVINLAIPKRHHAGDFSCALKNNFGCTGGAFRMLAHLRDEEFFDRSVAEFADAVQPDLTIVDARSLLAKSGPSFIPGQSEIVPGRRLVMTGDMAAADSFCADLMQQMDATFQKEKRVARQLLYARELGLGMPEATPILIRE